MHRPIQARSPVAGLVVIALALSIGCQRPSVATEPVASTPAPTGEADPKSAPSNYRGRLGLWLGTYVTIEGVREERRGKVSSNALLIDTVDGVKLAAPVTVDVHNIEGLTEGMRCVIKGYETGAMVGTPYEVALAGARDMTQTEFHFHIWFEATSVESPAELKYRRW